MKLAIERLNRLNDMQMDFNAARFATQKPSTTSNPYAPMRKDSSTPEIETSNDNQPTLPRGWRTPTWRQESDGQIYCYATPVSAAMAVTALNSLAYLNEAMTNIATDKSREVNKLRDQLADIQTQLDEARRAAYDIVVRCCVHPDAKTLATGGQPATITTNQPAQ